LSGHHARFRFAAPVFPVDDATETAEFYRTTLGFSIERLYGDPPYYAIVSRDGVEIHLSEREDTSTPIERCAVYIYVDDADALYEEFAGKGLKMFAPPEDQDNGMREFELTDNSGHFLMFGQRI
jgi:uncharacterized glyoxalase superfamily protein PhnB